MSINDRLIKKHVVHDVCSSRSHIGGVHQGPKQVRNISGLPPPPPPLSSDNNFPVAIHHLCIRRDMYWYLSQFNAHLISSRRTKDFSLFYMLVSSLLLAKEGSAISTPVTDLRLEEHTSPSIDRILELSPSSASIYIEANFAIEVVRSISWPSTALSSDDV